MKKKIPWGRCVLAAALAAVLLIAVLGGQGETDTEDTVKAPEVSYQRLQTQGFTAVAENDAYALLTKSDTAEIAVQCKNSGSIWYSNPQDREQDTVSNGRYRNLLNCQLTIQYANKDKSIQDTNNYVASVKKETYSCKTIDNGIRYEFHFSTEGFIIPVEYVLSEDGLRVSVVNEDIVQYGKNALIKYGLLPYFGCAAYEEAGYLVLPDGSGAVMPFDIPAQTAARYSEYYADVYGRDPAYTLKAVQNNTETVYVPTFGICRPQGGLFAWVEQGDALSSILAYPVNYVTSYSNAYFEATYRGIDEVILQEMTTSETTIKVMSEGPVSLPRYTVYYGFVEEKLPDYATLGSAVRNYMVQRMELTPTAHTEVPLYLQLIGSVAGTKTFLGVPYEAQQALTDYDEAAALVARLHQQGVGQICLSYNGWSSDIPYRTMEVSAKPSAELGGAKGLEALVAALREQGDRLFLTGERVRLYESGHGLSMNTDTARNISGGILHGSNYQYSVYRKDVDGPQWNYLKNDLFASVSEKWKASVDKQGADGCGVWGLGSLLYSDSHRSMLVKQQAVDRQQALTLSQEALALLAGEDSLLVDKGFAYSYPYATDLTSLPLTSSRYNAFREDVPFLQILLHGYVSYSSESINLQSDDDTYFLRMVEYGALPLYTFADTAEKSLRNTEYSWLTSPDAEAWMPTLTAQYERLSKVYPHVQDQPIVGHDRLAEGVYRTTYANGAQVIVNYNDTAVKAEGRTVPPRDFLLIAQ